MLRRVSLVLLLLLLLFESVCRAGRNSWSWDWDRGCGRLNRRGRLGCTEGREGVLSEVV